MQLITALRINIIYKHLFLIENRAGLVDSLTSNLRRQRRGGMAKGSKTDFCPGNQN